MGRMMMRSLAMSGLMGLALCMISAAPALAQNPASVSQEQFAELGWLEGRWVGTSGDAGTFYEQFRMLDDGTMEQTTYADASFSTPQKRSRIQFVGGFIMKSGEDEGQSIVTKLTNETVRFEWAGNGQPGYSWNRVSEDEWYAVLDQADQAPTVYNMRRVASAN